MGYRGYVDADYVNRRDVDEMSCKQLWCARGERLGQMGYMRAFADSGQNVISRMFRMCFSNFRMRRLIHLLAWT